MDENEFRQVKRVLLERYDYYGFVEITTKTISTKKQQDDPFPPNFRSQLRNPPVTEGLIHYKTKFFTERKPKDSPGGHRETFFLLKSKSSLYLIIYLYPPSSPHRGKFQRCFLSAVEEVIAPKLLTATYRFQKREGHVYEFWYPSAPFKHFHPPAPFNHFRRSQLKKLQKSGEITDPNLKTDL